MTMTAWDALHGEERHRLRYPSEHVVRFLASLPAGDGRPAVDLGSGSGRHAHLLVQYDYEVWTQDASRVFDPHACCDVASLDFPDDKFDVAIAYAVFYYGDRAHHVRAVRELRRILKPGGVGFICVRTYRDWRKKGIPEGEPEHGMDMDFLDVNDLTDVYMIENRFSAMTYELAEFTTDGLSRRNSDWLITVTK